MMRLWLTLVFCTAALPAHAVAYFMTFDRPNQTLTFSSPLKWKDSAAGAASYAIDGTDAVEIVNRVIFTLKHDSKVQFYSLNPGSPDRGELLGKFYLEVDSIMSFELFNSNDKPNEASAYANLPAGDHVAQFYGLLGPGTNAFETSYIYFIGVTPLPAPVAMLSVALAGGYFLARRRRAQPPAGQNGTPGSAATGNSTSG